METKSTKDTRLSEQLIVVKSYQASQQKLEQVRKNIQSRMLLAGISHRARVPQIAIFFLNQ